MAEKFSDIFFLVDSGVDFQQIRTVLTRLVNQMNIGASAHRLGLAQYGKEVKLEFNLNTYQTKEQTQNAIKRFRQRRLQPNEPRNLGVALRNATYDFFTSEAGSRADQGYRQYLVVLSGQNSSDFVYKEARLIKSSGVTVIGMSLGASMEEMRLIATSGYSYSWSTIANAVQNLKAILEETEEKINTTSGEILEHFSLSFSILSSLHVKMRFSLFRMVPCYHISPVTYSKFSRVNSGCL